MKINELEKSCARRRFVGSNPTPRIIMTVYNKLVRDKYKSLLAHKNAKFRVADEAEYRQKLREKITEEAYELHKSSSGKESK